MRLTHLKLAGFKSFVDPTTIHMHGQRIGVVGPNGCGKSNVMESVKWVLGESSAKEMRADAMDAVIFNGSANRKAISRASVELIFDNSMGGASGEWNQYAEISVKRVIEREKGSSYYINNTSVRRRDVADLFLGTGLGGRGYAIIGQNTISRIVEAKPEELRVFLEEAAGISKYKERRRETELRLRDTRENLTRVEDICKELQKQVNRLESQALITEKYINLQESLKHAEGQLWYLRKRDAANGWEATKAEVEKLANALEAKTAELRASENKLETTRQGHHSANEAINLAQAAYYEANAEVSNLENQVQQNQEARERMHQQLQQVEQSLERNAQQRQDFTTQLTQQEAEVGRAESLAEETAETLARLTQGLPDKDTALKQANEAVQQAQQALNQARQRIQIEQNNVQYLTQNSQDLTQRIARYEEELKGLSKPNQAEFSQHETLIMQLQEKQSTQEANIQQLNEQESSLLTQLNSLREAQVDAQRAFNQAEAEVHSLEKLQQSLNQESQLSEWLNQHGFKDSTRLWQQVQVKPQWQPALEAVLGARLNAIVTDSAAQQRPPSALVLGLNQAASMASNDKKGFTSLLSMLDIKDKALSGVLEDWLHGVYLLENNDAIASAKQLGAGECLVNAKGDIYTRHSVSYHGEQTGMQGVLERQQQLETAQQSLPILTTKLEAAVASLNNEEAALRALREQQQTESNALRAITNELHQAQMAFSKLKQAQESATNRERNITQELNAAQEKSKALIAQTEEKQTVITELSSSIGELEAQAEQVSTEKQTAEQTYFALRDDIQQAEKLHQEREFNKRLISNNINELNNKIKVNSEDKINLDKRQSEAKETLARTTMEALKENLSKAIDLKQLKEVALAKARDVLAEQDTALQAQERERMQNEQQLHPMRDALEQSRLREQEARLHFEQCQAGLDENGLDEAELAKDLSEETKTSELEDKTMKLERDIERLGPVNMAAIQELSGEKERKVYLDSQMEDLTQASETLENAIKKIDKETRSKLQTTFDEANRNFNELFSVLFGGGRAKLELLGEEILDTGVQVFAQPPGKKNATIQMLSGGEKALTATALVFALFRLNPAPFCLMDEVDAPLDDSNTERFCQLVKKMSEKTQFMIVSHNKITMEIMQQLIGVTMQESGVSRIVDVDLNAAMQMQAV